MKFYIYLCTVALLFCGKISKANHLFGGELNYRYISSNGDRHTYELTLSLYADCSNNFPGTAYSGLFQGNPQVLLLNDNTQIGSQRLGFVPAESNIEITPVCPDEAPFTTCKNINNPIPGIRKFVYRGEFVLVGTSSNWRFAFNGVISTDNIGNQTAAGRSTIIDNAQVINSNTATATIMYLEATLNNTIGQNNSTQFTSLPTPFFCLNRLSTYSLGAADVENDSLVFSLIPGKSIITNNVNQVEDIAYNNPYTANAPLPTAPGSFSFSNATGQMMFTPNLVMNCLVTNLVEEYRNGVRVGSSMREMTFVIMDNCNNDPANTDIDTVENAAVTVRSSDNLLLTICEGQEKNILFNVDALDPNGDNVTVTYSNLPSGASIIVDSNNTPNPFVRFRWNVTGSNPGLYIFYITYTDDGCPLVSTKTIAYTVNIVPHALGFEIGQYDPCENATDGKAWIMPMYNGPIDYKYRWVNENGDTLQEGNHLLGDTLFNLTPGRYTVFTHNEEGCGTHRVFDISNVSLPRVALEGDTVVCAGMPIRLEINEEIPGVAYNWNNTDTLTGCCITTKDSGTYVVTASNYCGVASDSVVIGHVKCNFCLFVPNAFSPNNDGRNDKFRILPTCVLNKYHIQIFSRWGEKVYSSFTLNDGWDGTYKGKPADVGVYYYLITATPDDLSKGEVFLKGDVTLIR